MTTVTPEKTAAGSERKTARKRAAALDAAFHDLKWIFAPHLKRLQIKVNSQARLYLETPASGKDAKPVFFGLVRARRVRVEFELMALYWEPALVKGLSPALKKHMINATTFVFTEPEPALFRELAKLTTRSMAWYRKQKLL